MTRPRCKYNVEFRPQVREFAPANGKDRGREVELSPEEAEALRLKNLQGLCQISAARRMKISQSTFQRVLSSAYRKISEALIRGRTIRLVEAKIILKKTNAKH